MTSLESGIKAAILGIMVNTGLAIIKIITGFTGHSYALIADGIESTADVISSVIVWSGLRISAAPPDPKHPYGHGKAESIAGLFVSMLLFGAALFIIIHSIKDILVPHKAPEWYTLIVLMFVIITKEILFRFVISIGDAIDSTALRGDAWHHRADALTSAAALIGISIALIGGEGYESADSWAALFACVIITFNGIKIFRTALDEVMDATVPQMTKDETVRIAKQVEGVLSIGKCRIRKSGITLLVDIHVQVEGKMSVKESHAIAHLVKDELIKENLNISDVVVHIEPYHPGEAHVLLE
ncbi:MAG: cation diffusion facilitator family transporter [Candidatus Brocadiaceae bacterium]|nr:cation diffusion facilitator family transporter [Candidatus Brocadiaceae bacterium]